MTLTYPVFDKPIEFMENEINILVIEDGTTLLKFVRDIQIQIDGGDGKAVLSEEYKPIKIAKTVSLTTDFFGIDPNSKKIQTKLFSILCENSIAEEMYMDTNNFISNAEAYFSAVLDTFETPLTYTYPDDITPFLKALNVKIDSSPEEPDELVCCFIDVLGRYIKTDLFIFVNLKSYLSPEQIDTVYDFAIKNKYRLLLVENNHKERKRYEKIKIIDCDLCDIDG